jgi:uroporphyrinogen decarboxylase
MTLEYGKRNFGDKICIIGNIDIAYLLPFGSAEDVKKAVKNAINTAAPGGGYILSASNVITDEVKPENFLIQIRAGKKYGKYPLSCKIQNN